MQSNSEKDNLEVDIFNMQPEEVVTQQAEGYEADPDVYRPSLKNSKVKENGYESLIRFVPNVFAKADNLPVDQHHKIHKWIYYLKNPNNLDKNFYVDCTSSDPANKGKKTSNIITEAFFHLYKSDSAQMRAIAKENFSRKEFWWSLVQIITDEFEPEIQGKIKIFRFGSQINDIIEAAAKGNEKFHVAPINVYHPLTGRDMILAIKKEMVQAKDNSNKEITGYSSSKFLDISMPMTLDLGKSRMGTDAESMTKISTFLKENSPHLSKVAYTPWDSELEQKVIESVRLTVDDPKTFDQIYFKFYKKAFSGEHTAAPQSHKEENHNGSAAMNTNPAAENNMADLSKNVASTSAASAETPNNAAAPQGNTENFSTDFNADDLP